VLGGAGEGRWQDGFQKRGWDLPDRWGKPTEGPVEEIAQRRKARSIRRRHSNGGSVMAWSQARGPARSRRVGWIDRPPGRGPWGQEHGGDRSEESWARPPRGGVQFGEGRVVRRSPRFTDFYEGGVGSGDGVPPLPGPKGPNGHSSVGHEAVPLRRTAFRREVGKRRSNEIVGLRERACQSWIGMTAGDRTPGRLPSPSNRLVRPDTQNAGAGGARGRRQINQ